MNRVRSRKPLLLVSLGLVGVALWAMGNAYGFPRPLQSDFARGLCLGLCLGAEMMGGILLYKQKQSSKLGR